MEDLDGVEADGELAGEGHKDEETVEDEEGSSILPLENHLLKHVTVAHVLEILRSSQGIRNGQQFGQNIRIRSSESLHHLKMRLAVFLCICHVYIFQDNFMREK